MLNLIAFAMVFSRILGAVFFLPIMTQATSIPSTLKAGFSLILALIAYTAYPFSFFKLEDVPTLILMILMVKELLVGIILSFIMNVFFQVYNFAGQLWGVQGGLSQSMIHDASSGSQVSALGKYYGTAFGLVFFVSGGYHWFIRALVETFEHIPIGEVSFKGSLLATVVETITAYWVLGIKIAAPILGVIFIVDCGLGILARTVPQMNMFAIGIPLKTTVLFVFILVTLVMFSDAIEMINDQLIEAFYNAAKGMIP